MDFFTVPTLTFGVLYCFFVIGHDRRKILHFNVTRNPNALWVIQQLREAWAYKQPHRFLLFDRDAKFGAEVLSAVRDNGKRANSHGLSQSVAERCCGALGGKLPTRLAGPRDQPFEMPLINRIHTYATKNRPFWTLVEVLANYRDFHFHWGSAPWLAIVR